MNHRIPSAITISDEEIDNIVDSAINWCSYWCDLLEYGTEPTGVTAMSEALSHGGTLVFHIDEPYEEGGETRFELTTEKMLAGLAKYGDINFEDYDGPMSDEAVQTALFGEVIYG